MQPPLLKQKLKAVLISALISAAVLAVILSVAYLMWYPAPYDRIQGIHRVSWMLVAVQLALGPLLTAIVYRKGKETLKLDLTVIAALQLFALAYGTVALYLERPWFMVFTDDHFKVLARREVDFTAIGDPGFLAKPWAGPVMVIATMPEDPGEAQRLLEGVLFEDQPRLERRPEYWSRYADGFEHVLAEARTLAELRAAREDAATGIGRLTGANVRTPDELLWVPVRGKYRDFAAVLDPGNGTLLGAIATNPWLR